MWGLSSEVCQMPQQHLWDGEICVAEAKEARGMPYSLPNMGSVVSISPLVHGWAVLTPHPTQGLLRLFKTDSLDLPWHPWESSMRLHPSAPGIPAPGRGTITNQPPFL